MSNLSEALLITLLGMGLVFAMILLLWGLMAFMVSVLAPKDTADDVAPQLGDQDASRKRKAAAVAVATALVNQADTRPHEFPLPPTALVSAWQAVMRTDMLKKRGPKR